MRGPKYRKRGTGQIYKVHDNRYRATIIINKIRHEKSFKKEEEAEQFMLEIVHICNFIKTFEIL